MKDLFNNIKFSYLYRDAGNYKLYGSIVFSNPDFLDIGVIDLLIRRNLIDGEFFNPNKWQLPVLHFNCLNDCDHEWHEFESIKYCNEIANIDLSINSFLNKINNQIILDIV